MTLKLPPQVDIIHIVLLALLIATGFWVAKEWRSAAAWEKTAVAAQQFEARDSVIADSALADAAKWKAKASASDTTRKRQVAQLAPTAVTPADTATLAAAKREVVALKARADSADAIVKDDTKRLDNWARAWSAEINASAHLKAERDSLANVVKNRPTVAGLTLELLHPRIQVALVEMFYPEFRTGVAVSIPIASFPIKISL